MQPEKQSPYTFIVHLWREQTEGSAFVWRGSVDCVQSGERAYFQSLEKVVEVVSHMVKLTLENKAIMRDNNNVDHSKISNQGESR